MINPRGSTGHGQKFVDGVNGDWGGKPCIDLMRGLDFAEKKFPFIDKSRERALGASYSGFMANWILTHTNRFACIVTHDGMANPRSAYGTTEELWFNEWEFHRQTPAGPAKEPAQPWRYATGSAERNPFRKWSPVRHISHAKTPTLVIHGQRDYRLDVSEGLQLFTALQRRGVPAKFCISQTRAIGSSSPELRALVQDRQRLARSLDPQQRVCYIEQNCTGGQSLARLASLILFGSALSVEVAAAGSLT